MSEFRCGLICLVDALGFAGIYRKHSPDKVLGEMLQIRQHLQAEFDRYRESNKWLIGASMGLRLFSDTVAISIQLRDEDFTEHNAEVGRFACFTLCELALELTACWAHADVPLTFRGVITAGQYCADQEFIIGPAVDEAASLYEAAKGAFIWLAPSAIQILAPDGIGMRCSNVLLTPYAVPLEHGDSVNTLVLHTGLTRRNGIGKWKHTSDTDLQRMQLDTFDASRLDVLVKKQNTERFFQHALNEDS